jgi:hypothetical protein
MSLERREFITAARLCAAAFVGRSRRAHRPVPVCGRWLLQKLNGGRTWSLSTSGSSYSSEFNRNSTLPGPQQVLARLPQSAMLIIAKNH